MSTARYIFAVLLVVGIPPAVIWWYFIHPFVGFWRRVGKAATYVFTSIFFFGGFAGLYFIKDALVLTDLGTNWVLVALAVVLVVASIRIALARRKYLTFAILAGGPELDADGKGGKLLDEGIYSRVRHPRYIEVALGCFAYAAFSNYLGAWLMALATLPGLHSIVILEEKELAQRFGEEYEAYKARVPRYIPRRKS